MNKLLLSALLFVTVSPATAQINITANDMPVSGDTLRYSMASPATPGLDFASTGSAFTWDFSTLTPIAQVVDTYKFAAQVNITYAGTISPTAYGYKIADSLPGAPVPVKELYNFFNKKNSPLRFVVEGFAAKVAGTPVPINYSDEDEVYLFPLTNTRTPDTTTFKLTFTSPFGSFSQQGTRRTYVDGYGTIKTPYATTAVSVLRIRSEISEVDSFTFGGNTQAIPRNTVEYKWLSNTEHMPMLVITTNKLGGNETVSSVRYRDIKRAGVGVAPVKTAWEVLQAYPSPATNNVTVSVPGSWKNYRVHLYDVTGKLLSSVENTATVNTATLPSGKYLITVESAGQLGAAQFVK